MSGHEIPLKTVRREGGGLYVEIFTGYSDNDYTFLLAPIYKGISVLVEDQAAFPLKKIGMLAETGTYASVIVEKFISSSLPQPYSNCLESDTINTLLSEELKKLGLSYNHRNCMDLCEQKQNIDQLGCYNLKLPKILNAQPCDNKTAFERLSEMVYNSDTCTSLCPFECKMTYHPIYISYADFPSWNYYYDTRQNNLSFFQQFFGSNTSYDKIKLSLAPVNIYFDALTVTNIDEAESLSIVNLISYIGGTLGLFVGASVLTFAEIIVLIFNLFLRTIEKKFCGGV